MSKESYARGFVKAAAAAGVDPGRLAAYKAKCEAFGKHVGSLPAANVMTGRIPAPAAGQTSSVAGRAGGVAGPR